MRDDCAQSGDILIYISIDSHLMLRIFHSVCECVGMCVSACVCCPLWLSILPVMASSNYASRSWTRRSKQRTATHTQIASVGQGRIYLLQPQLGKRNCEREDGGSEGGCGNWTEGGREDGGGGEADAVQGYLLQFGHTEKSWWNEYRIICGSVRRGNRLLFPFTSLLSTPSAQKEKCQRLCMLPSRRATKCKSNVMDDLSTLTGCPRRGNGGPMRQWQ